MTQEELIHKIEALIAEVKLDYSPAELKTAATPVEIDRIVTERVLLVLLASIKLSIPHLLDQHVAIFMQEVDRVCTVESLNHLLFTSNDKS